MILIRNIRMELGEDPKEIREKIAKKLKISSDEITEFRLLRRSLDARKKGDIHYICSAAASLSCSEAKVVRKAKDASEYSEFSYKIPKIDSEKRPVIIGFGPAGMFAALVLARAGLRPIVIERGEDADTRAKKVEIFRTTGVLDPNSNVQFGEGGAGTFSDGKLNTGIHDPRLRWVLEEFHKHGAHESVTYDAKPHVGTDVLVRIVKSIREEVKAAGGEVRFEQQLMGLKTENGVLSGLIIADHKTGEETEVECDYAILAIGHSARDTFEMLARTGVPMEPKAFSMGVRIEHRQSTINLSQYGKEESPLPAADYSLHVHLPDGNSAYTFCMCPGGYVIAAASEEGGVVTNGMSYSDRNGENANSALLVTLRPEDFPDPSVLGGMYWQRQIERAAFSAGGNNYKAPAQLCGDFLRHAPSSEPHSVSPTYRPGVVWTDLHQVLPTKITEVLEKAIPALGEKMKNFDNEDAVLTAPETRSSSPVRILRDENKSSTGVYGLFPCGEGAGYAGGISSAAVDGMRCAEAVIQMIQSKNIDK